MSIRCAIIFILCISLFLIMGTSYAEEVQYPMKVEIINKDQAKYDTPENAFAAGLSALIKENLEWYYDTLTKESAEEDKKEYKEAGIDPQKKFDIAKGSKGIFIINKLTYKDGVLLVCKSYEENGAIIMGPSIFIKKNGLWKTTFKFAADEELWGYMDYFSSLFDGKGQRPADVNTFLAYANPTQMKTNLPAGTSKFPLHIFYGQSINPATFKAELNRQDISSQFDPKPVGDQTVELRLKKGRNVLILSIEGEKEDKKTAKDSDRLVFVVP